MNVIVPLVLFLFIVALFYIAVIYFISNNDKGNDDSDKKTPNPFDEHDFI